MPLFEMIAFDADDTLWQNERLYHHVQSEFKNLLAYYHSAEWVEQRLYDTEMRNLAHFGYGIKAFALSMIETAIELTEGRISGAEIQKIIELARQMLTTEIDLLENAAETLQELHSKYPLMVITKGDLRDQEIKMARSGLAQFFRHVEIVSDKFPQNYAAILQRHAINPQRFLMVGNSLKSDILPVLSLGGSAVYVPHALTWSHENASLPEPLPAGFHQIEHLGQLPGLITRLERQHS